MSRQQDKNKNKDLGMDKENEEGAKKPQIGREIEIILQHEQDAFEALFEVLGLSQEQIDKFNAICDKKMYDRADKERQVKERFLQLIAEKENS
jgi:hypothetical protein